MFNQIVHNNGILTNNTEREREREGELNTQSELIDVNINKPLMEFLIKSLLNL